MTDTARDMNVVGRGQRSEAGEVWVERVMGDRDYENFGPTFRSHYQTTYATTGRPYTEYEPSYRFGYDLAYDEDYRGREWDDLAEDAARDWGAQFDQAWEDVKENVRYAWNEVRDALDMDDDGRVLDMDTGPGMRSTVSQEWSGVRQSFRPTGDNPTMNDLHDLLVEEIQDLHSAETQILQALPKMISATWSNELRTALQDHLAQTQTHVTRLQQIASSISQSPQGKECKGMRGVIQEGDETLQKAGPSATRDAAIIGAAQRVEHYEMASYGTARTHARELGYDEIADLLQTTLDEEGDADKLLTSIAEGGLFEEGINEMAEKSM
jgi:ferritin-like metal-binding protein YciE